MSIDKTSSPFPNRPGAGGGPNGVELLASYPDLLGVPHLSEITGQSEQTIRGLITGGKLPGCRIGRRLYVSKNSLLAYIDEGRGM